MPRLNSANSITPEPSKSMTRKIASADNKCCVFCNNVNILVLDFLVVSSVFTLLLQKSKIDEKH